MSFLAVAPNAQRGSSAERFYNLTRRHSTLGYVSPIRVSDERWFDTLCQAREALAAWREDFNTVRPQRSCRRMPPAAGGCGGLTLLRQVRSARAPACAWRRRSGAVRRSGRALASVRTSALSVRGQLVLDALSGFACQRTSQLLGQVADKANRVPCHRQPETGAELAGQRTQCSGFFSARSAALAMCRRNADEQGVARQRAQFRQRMAHRRLRQA